MRSFVRNLRLPVIQAPMAGGINNPSFAAAATKAGGVGSFGFAYSTPEQISTDLRSFKAECIDMTVHANFFVFGNVADPAPHEVQQVVDFLTMLNSPSINPEPLSKPYFSPLEEQLEPVWKHRPKLLTFHFGLPSVAISEKAHSLDMLVGATVTCMQEALAVQKHGGIDFIVAQGSEAGGHCGCFDPGYGQDDGEFEQTWLPTLRLVQQLSQHSSALPPIVAAGGIMDGRDIQEMLRLGGGEGGAVVAVQMGTAFLHCHESTASPMHKQLVIEGGARRPSIMTRAFSGRLARCLANEYTDRWAEAAGQGQVKALQFPLQNSLTKAMRRAAGARNDAEFQSLYMGSNVRRAKKAMSVAELMSMLEREMKNT